MISEELFYNAVVHHFNNINEIVIRPTVYTESSVKILKFMKKKCRKHCTKNAKLLSKFWNNSKVKDEVKKRLEAKALRGVQPQNNGPNSEEPLVIGSSNENMVVTQAENRHIMIVEEKNKEIAHLTVKVHELMQTNENLSKDAENRHLMTVEEKNKEIAHLKAKVHELMQINANLSKDMSQMTFKNSGVERKVTELLEKNANLSENIKKYRLKGSELQKNHIRILNDTIQQLKNEYVNRSVYIEEQDKLINELQNKLAEGNGYNVTLDQYKKAAIHSKTSQNDYKNAQLASKAQVKQKAKKRSEIGNQYATPRKLKACETVVKDKNAIIRMELLGKDASVVTTQISKRNSFNYEIETASPSKCDSNSPMGATTKVSKMGHYKDMPEITTSSKDEEQADVITQTFPSEEITNINLLEFDNIEVEETYQQLSIPVVGPSRSTEVDDANKSFESYESPISVVKQFVETLEVDSDNRLVLPENELNTQKPSFIDQNELSNLLTVPMFDKENDNSHVTTKLSECNQCVPEQTDTTSIISNAGVNKEIELPAGRHASKAKSVDTLKPEENYDRSATFGNNHVAVEQSKIAAAQNLVSVETLPLSENKHIILPNTILINQQQQSKQSTLEVDSDNRVVLPEDELDTQKPSFIAQNELSNLLTVPMFDKENNNSHVTTKLSECNQCVPEQTDTTSISSNTGVNKEMELPAGRHASKAKSVYTLKPEENDDRSATFGNNHVAVEQSKIAAAQNLVSVETLPLSENKRIAKYNINQTATTKQTIDSTNKTGQLENLPESSRLLLRGKKNEHVLKLVEEPVEIATTSQKASGVVKKWDAREVKLVKVMETLTRYSGRSKTNVVTALPGKRSRKNLLEDKIPSLKKRPKQGSK